MPKNKDIKKVLVIGSGPIVIGQAAEFDYAGTQACRSLKEEGVEVVLVNSNPATIMTDKEIADEVYIEPLTVEVLEQIIAKEKPDSVLPTLGGQAGLNLGMELAEKGILDKYGVKLIGTTAETIFKAEDRQAFKDTMEKIGEPCAASQVVNNVQDGIKFTNTIGYPVVLRPAFTLGGSGGGIAHNEQELVDILTNGLRLSRVGEVLVERCIAGWKEIEYEVMRDANGNCITVCNMENIDPVGVHTGDSIVVAPSQTLGDKEYQMLRTSALNIISELNITGGCNVQYALKPDSFEYCVIEVNPRVSRSSALASKATGYPIAKVAAKIALGYTLDEIKNAITGKTYASFEPMLDYCVVKIPRLPFDKFITAKRTLTTQMKATGEVMSICNNFEGALMKAIRSLEKSRYGLGHVKDFDQKSKKELLTMHATPSSERYFIMYEALRKGASVEEINKLTKVKDYFIEQMKELVEEEEKLVAAYHGQVPADADLKQAKLDGFSDKYLSQILEVTEEEIRNARIGYGIEEAWEGVHVSGTKDNAYYYSSYHIKDESKASDNKNKIMILGGGPNRIGQGIEFDYCCVHAAMALKKAGFETIIVNCNPETVSTDYDTSDKLYFEPLTLEDVLSIYKKEKPLGVIAQFGGQTPLNLSAELEKYGVKILGTSPAVIDMAEDRDLFRAMMDKLQIPMPEAGMAVDVDEALAIAERIGYPVMVRPSYVLGGRGMEVVYDDEALTFYMQQAVGVTPDRPILIDRFLHHATECEADAISDGEHVFVPSVMEHIELAGIHSGDSACIIPPRGLTEEQIETLKDYTRKIAKELHVVGLMNMQYAIEDGVVYVLEANPRASRTVPLVSKVCAISMVPLATEIITSEFTGKESPIKDQKDREIPYYGVKEAVFPFNMFQEVDPLLGPEMRSTGEVLGLAQSVGEAYFKAQEATKSPLPLSGTVLISVGDREKAEVAEVAKRFHEAGFAIIATRHTKAIIEEAGIPAEFVYKMSEGRPNIYDIITNGKVDLVVNTPKGEEEGPDDSYVRRACIKSRVPYITTMAAALASAEGILTVQKQSSREVVSLQDLHARIK